MVITINSEKVLDKIEEIEQNLIQKSMKVYGLRFDVEVPQVEQLENMISIYKNNNIDTKPLTKLLNETRWIRCGSHIFTLYSNALICVALNIRFNKYEFFVQIKDKRIVSSNFGLLFDNESKAKEKALKYVADNYTYLNSIEWLTRTYDSVALYEGFSLIVAQSTTNGLYYYTIQYGNRIISNSSKKNAFFDKKIDAMQKAEEELERAVIFFAKKGVQWNERYNDHFEGQFLSLDLVMSKDTNNKWIVTVKNSKNGFEFTYDFNTIQEADSFVQNNINNIYSEMHT